MDARWLMMVQLVKEAGLSNGELWAWGHNTDSQVGDGTKTARHSPIRIGSEFDWEMISAGQNHSLGIRNGELWAWGLNSSGRLGDGTTIDRHSPVRIGSESDWAMISAGVFHSLGITKP